MIAEITAAVQSFRAVSDLIQANHTLRNFNELVTAVYEVNAKLLAVQSVALTSQEKQATLTQRISELEKENMELKNWDRERERYELAEITTGMFAYRLKPGMEAGEPLHHLCANCFTKGEKAILQFLSFPDKMYRCQRCGSIMPVRAGTIGTAKLVRS